MRFANVEGRMQLVVADGTIDVAESSGNKLPSDPQACLDVWDDLVEWATTASGSDRTSCDGDAPRSGPAAQTGRGHSPQLPAPRG